MFIVISLQAIAMTLQKIHYLVQISMSCQYIYESGVIIIHF